jgi:hypothetical protein
VSNNDCAQFGISLNNISGCFSKVHPNVNLNEAQKVTQFGEVEYNKEKLRDSLRWIVHHPARFAQLSAMRFVAFWFPNESGKLFRIAQTHQRPITLPPLGASAANDFKTEQSSSLATGMRNPDGSVDSGNRESRKFERIVIYLLTLLSGVGLMLLRRRDFQSMGVCLSCLLFFPLIYYFVQFEDRYRYPIMWVTFLLGALPITTLLRGFLRSRISPTNPLRRYVQWDSPLPIEMGRS